MRLDCGRPRTSPSKREMDAKTAGDATLENISKVLKKVRDYAILIFTYILYTITRSLVVSVQKFTWAVTGVERTRRSAKSGLNFKQSAHIQEIFWRRKIHNIEVANTKSFITYHKGFKHPSYVLKPHITLYCINKDEAVFVETDEGGRTNNNKSDRPSTFYMYQFLNAKRIITMPLGSFHKIAQDLGDPKVPVIWISGTGKCGATLLSHVFEAVPGTSVLEEPDVLTNLAFLRKSKLISGAEYDQLLASAVRLLCKPDDKAGMFCIKTRPCCCGQMEEIYRLLPKIRHIFVYRNSLRTISSYLAAMSSDSLAKSVRLFTDHAVLSPIFPCVKRFVYNSFCGVLDKGKPLCEPSSLTTVGIFTTTWARCIAYAVDCSDKGVPILVILYEEMIKNPKRTCDTLFQHLHIRPQYALPASQMFRMDFNRNPAHSEPESRRSIPPEMRTEADTVLKKYGLPRLGERYEVPGLLNFDTPLYGKSLSRDRLL